MEDRLLSAGSKAGGLLVNVLKAEGFLLAGVKTPGFSLAENAAVCFAAFPPGGMKTGAGRAEAVAELT